jgi:hypothetical protein
MSILLGTLRILHHERLNTHVEVVGLGALQRRYGVGLVHLDADDSASHPEALHHDADAEVNALGILHHGAVIRGEVRLALGAIHQEPLELQLLGWRQLHVGGERRTPQAHHTRTLNRASDLVRREPMPVRHLSRPRNLRAVRLHIDNHRFRHGAIRVGPPIDVGHGTRGGRVDRHGHEAVRLGDLVTPLDPVALSHETLGRLAGVLAQRKDQAIPERHPPDPHMLREDLRVGRMHPVPEGDAEQVQQRSRFPSS